MTSNLNLGKGPERRPTALSMPAPKHERVTLSASMLHVALAVVSTIVFIFTVAVITLGLHVDTRPPPPPKNIIFMVSDGFGEAGLSLARLYKNTVLERQPLPEGFTGGPTGTAAPPLRPLNLDTFVAGDVHTYSASSLITDSAAGATAWACAQKTNNGYVGTDRFDRPCGTLMEAAKAAGMATGVAVTSSVTDATPASWATHGMPPPP